MWCGRQKVKARAHECNGNGTEKKTEKKGRPKRQGEWKRHNNSKKVAITLHGTTSHYKDVRSRWFFFRNL